MAKSLLDQLPSIVAARKRQAAQILEQLERQNRVSLHARELVILAKGRVGFDLWGDTKAQSALNDENVMRKESAVLGWCEQVDELPDEKRSGRHWPYVLLGETIVKDWKKKDARASEVLDYARLRRFSTARQEKLL